jgi:hypothetical protein
LTRDQYRQSRAGPAALFLAIPMAYSCWRWVRG